MCEAIRYELAENTCGKKTATHTAPVLVTECVAVVAKAHPEFTVLLAELLKLSLEEAVCHRSRKAEKSHSRRKNIFCRKATSAVCS